MFPTLFNVLMFPNVSLHSLFHPVNADAGVVVVPDTPSVREAWLANFRFNVPYTAIPTQLTELIRKIWLVMRASLYGG